MSKREKNQEYVLIPKPYEVEDCQIIYFKININIFHLIICQLPFF
jgi:hypothetical protein